MQIYLDADLIVHHAVAPSTTWKVGKTIFKTKRDATAHWIMDQGADRITKRYIDPSPRAVRTQLDNMIKTWSYKALSAYMNTVGISRADKRIYLVIKGDSLNYRREYAKTVLYKANRGPKPYYYQYARQYLIDNCNVIYANGQESDDVLGILMGNGNLVVSMDKDLRTVPGLVFDPYYGVLHDIKEKEADRAFYTQLLTGDRADNIPGLYGVGPVRAERILEGASDKKDMLRRVLHSFERHRHVSPRRARDMVDELGKLLYIRRKPGEIWSVEEVLYG